MAAITLAEVAKQEQEPLRKMILAELLRQSDLIGVIPFENVSSFDSILVRISGLPSVTWRDLNAGYGTSGGTREQVTETIYLLGGDVEIDRKFKDIKNLLEPIEKTETRLKLAAIAYEFNDTFINGSHLINPRQYEGIVRRLANMPARQQILATAAGATVLPCLQGATQANQFIDQLCRLMTLVEGKPTHLFMNSTTLWGLEAILRRSGQLTTTKDAFEREFTTFKGAMLVDVGLSSMLTTGGTEAALEIITNTETAADGNADSTSIYAVHMEVGRGCHGIQLNDLEVYDPLKGAERESGPQTLLRIDWGVGLANWSNYSIARLYNFGMVYA